MEELKPAFQKRQIPVPEPPARAKRKTDVLTFLNWTFENRVIPNKSTGRVEKFSLDEYPWLEYIYSEIGTLRPGWRGVIRKAAQMGLTELAINLAFYAIDEYGARIFYALPPGLNVVGDFAHDRIDTAISQNPYLQDMAGGTDNVGLKTFKGGGALYLRGTNIPKGRPDLAPQLASVPADVAILDELDRIPPAAIPLIRDRMGDSRIGAELSLSTPTYPGMGIDAEYQASDQREAQIQCQACGAWHWLAWELVADRDGQIAVWCPTCHEAIDRLAMWSDGRVRFRPRNPDSDTFGYWISKLASSRVSIEDLWKRSLSTDAEKVLAFWNNDLGLAYEPEGARISLELMRACADDYEMPDTAQWTAMGVDVGYTLYVWIIKQMENGRQRAVYIDEVLNWEDLDRLMVRYGVGCCVVDDGPELTADIAFAQRHRGKVFLASYVADIPGAEWCQFNLPRQKVTIDRTTGLDTSHGNIEAQLTSLPRDFEQNKGLVEQMQANIKVKSVNADGITVYVFPKSGRPDHYDHAHVYALAALDRLNRLRAPDKREQVVEGPSSDKSRQYTRVRGRL